MFIAVILLVAILVWLAWSYRSRHGRGVAALKAIDAELARRQDSVSADAGAYAEAQTDGVLERLPLYLLSDIAEAYHAEGEAAPIAIDRARKAIADYLDQHG